MDAVTFYAALSGMGDLTDTQKAKVLAALLSVTSTSGASGSVSGGGGRTAPPPAAATATRPAFGSTSDASGGGGRTAPPVRSGGGGGTAPPVRSGGGGGTAPPVRSGGGGGTAPPVRSAGISSSVGYGAARIKQTRGSDGFMIEFHMGGNICNVTRSNGVRYVSRQFQVVLNDDPASCCCDYVRRLPGGKSLREVELTCQHARRDMICNHCGLVFDSQFPTDLVVT